jgi:O-antigen/teichoic acid export membrane protein
VRQIARSEPVGKTGLLSSTFFILAAIPIYLAYVYFTSDQSNIIFDSMLLGIILIPVYFLSNALVQINLGHKPHAVSYGNLTFEITKIPLALGLIVFFELGINGAILTILLSYFARIIIQIYFGKNVLQTKFQFIILKNWIKLSPIPLYNTSANYLKNLDVLLFPIIIGSVIGVAYYFAAFTISNLVIHSSLIAQALYPKLLAEGKYRAISENFSLLLFFAIPLTTMSILFAKPGLFALNPVYQFADSIVMVLSFKILLIVFHKYFQQILLGLENVDIEKNVKFSKLLHSKLFLIPTINIIEYLSYIIIFVILLTFNSNISDLELVYWWALLGFLIEIPFVVYLFILVRNNSEFSIRYKEIIKYIFAASVVIAIYLTTSDFIIKYHTSIYDFIPGVIIEAIICIAIYLGITYAIDMKTRKIFQSILSEISIKRK